MKTHTVLVIEDEAELRDTMCEALDEEGYAVVPACDGQEALDAIGRIDRLCLIMLDLLMPGMNGWDFVVAFHAAHPELAHVPIVVHSSAPSRAPKGVTRVVRKPLKLERMLAIAHEFCGPQ